MESVGSMPNPRLTQEIQDNMTAIYNSDFEMLIDEFKDLYPHTDITKSQDNWVACLEYIFKRVLYSETLMPNGSHYKVPFCFIEFYEALARKYVSLCRLYSRWAKFEDYLTLCGIMFECDFYRICQNEDRRVGTFWVNFPKNFEKISQNSIENKLFDSNSPVGQITIGNNRFGWSNPYNSNAVIDNQIAQTADDRAQRLGLNLGISVNNP